MKKEKMKTQIVEWYVLRFFGRQNESCKLLPLLLRWERGDEDG
jgi:hypothetical protein